MNDAVKSDQSAIERAEQNATRAYLRSVPGRAALDQALGKSHTGRLAAPVTDQAFADYAPRNEYLHGNDLRAADGGTVLEAGPVSRFPGVLDPEFIGPLMTIDKLLEAARVKLAPPQLLVVHTSHLDEHDRQHVRTEYIARKINGEWHDIPRAAPLKPAFMCANGHALGSGTDWCYRCDEADQDRRSMPLVPVQQDNETRMFDERELARQSDDEYVRVGDHPPERRRRW